MAFKELRQRMICFKFRNHSRREGVSDGGAIFEMRANERFTRDIMEYGSTPYVGMARGKMAAPYKAYKIIRSELGSDYSHRLL